MASIDKQIEKLELYRKKKEKEKKNGPSLLTVFRQRLQMWSSHLVHYILPDNIQINDAKLKLNNINGRNLNDNLGIIEDERNNVYKASKSSHLNATLIPPEETEEKETCIIAHYTKIDWLILLFKILLWVIIWKLFILVEFGAIFFILSCLAFIWFNLNSGARRRGGLSAYSVFNPNCEELLGSYTAEKFEKELLHR